jgi:hypothetical protein
MTPLLKKGLLAGRHGAQDFIAAGAGVSDQASCQAILRQGVARNRISARGACFEAVDIAAKQRGAEVFDAGPSPHVS